MPEVSQELFDALIAGHANKIAEILENNPIQVPRGPNPEPQAVEDWFTRVNRANILLAQEYGVLVNAMGVSEGPAVAETRQRAIAYQKAHPDDIFIQKNYSQLLTEGRVKPILDSPESGVDDKIAQVIRTLPEDRKIMALGLLETISKT